MARPKDVELTPTLEGIALKPVVAKGMPNIYRTDYGRTMLVPTQDRSILHRVLRQLIGAHPQAVIDELYGQS